MFQISNDHTRPSVPQDVITMLWLAAAMALLAAVWKFEGMTRYALLATAVVFAVGAWGVRRQMAWARWGILLLGVLPQLALVLYQPSNRSWSSWIGVAVMLWVAWHLIRPTPGRSLDFDAGDGDQS